MTGYNIQQNTNLSWKIFTYFGTGDGANSDIFIVNLRT